MRYRRWFTARSEQAGLYALVEELAQVCQPLAALVATFPEWKGIGETYASEALKFANAAFRIPKASPSDMPYGCFVGERLLFSTPYIRFSMASKWEKGETHIYAECVLLQDGWPLDNCPGEDWTPISR